MKKVLRFLLILIVILFVGYLILCATSPKEMTVERSTVIDAPKEMVWHQMVNLKNWDNWSPWKEMDSTMVSTNSGPDGQVGDKNEWVGETSGSGNMTIASVDGYTMKYDMHFIEPYDSKASGWVMVEDAEEGGTKATWGFVGESSFMMRGFSNLFMKKMLESQFERGMELLKEHIESGEAEMPTPTVSKATFPATEFVAIRKEMSFDEMEAFFSEAYQKLAVMAGDKISGTAHGITYKWDEENGRTDVAAAFPVSAPVKGQGVEMISIPEKQGYVATYTGPYSGLYSVHMAVYTEAAKNGIEDPFAIEVYEVMPPQETDTNKFVTKVYHLER